MIALTADEIEAMKTRANEILCGYTRLMDAPELDIVMVYAVLEALFEKLRSSEAAPRAQSSRATPD